MPRRAGRAGRLVQGQPARTALYQPNACSGVFHSLSRFLSNVPTANENQQQQADTTRPKRLTALFPVHTQIPTCLENGRSFAVSSSTRPTHHPNLRPEVLVKRTSMPSHPAAAPQLLPAHQHSCDSTIIIIVVQPSLSRSCPSTKSKDQKERVSRLDGAPGIPILPPFLPASQSHGLPP